MQVKSTRGVQQDDVSAAADALLAEQLKPTIERVRLKLGRGSPNTVGPLLDEWFSMLGARLGVTTDGQLTGALPMSLKNAMSSMWQAALSESRFALEATYSETQAKLAQQAQDLDQEKTNIQAERVALNQKEAISNESLRNLQMQLQIAMEQVLHYKTAIEAKDAELKDVQATVQQQVHESNELRRVSSEQVRVLTEELQQLSGRFEGTERRLLLDLDRERQSSRKAVADGAAAQERFYAEKSRLESSVGDLQKKLYELQAENSVFNERIMSCQQRNDDLLKQLETQRQGVQKGKRIAAGASKGRQR